MKYSLLILLAFAVSGFAQPLVGPFDVTEADEAIHHIQVAARNDSVADVFYQIGNDAYHAAFALDLGMMYSGPNAFDNLGDNWIRRLIEATRIEGGWAALVLDTNTIVNQAVVFSGLDQIDSLHIVDTGEYNGWHYSSWIEDASNGLRARYAAGYLTSWTKWTVTWLGGFWCALLVRELKEYSSDFPDGYCMEGCWWETPGFVQSLGQDCTIVLAHGWGDVMLCQLPYWSEHAFERTLDCNITVKDFVVTQSGMYLVLGTDQVAELDTASESCVVRSEFDEQPVASAAELGLGFAWLSQPSSGLLLNRADTTGALVHPAGVVHWPEQDQRIIESNLDITDNGKIVMVWTEQPLDAETPMLLKIAAVNWSTPLSTGDPNFIPHPSSLVLSSYPNPFNAQTTLSFVLPQAGEVSLRVYDISGRLVRTLIQNERMTAGEHRFVFDAAGLPSGIYLCQLDLENAKIVQKVVLLR